MSFRKEKKYKLSYHELSRVKRQLIDKGMNQIHPDRIVNSCYFDNNYLKMYSDSNEGLLPRKKIRFRWYNNEKFFFKETKISTIEGRYKIIKKLNYKNFSDFSRIKIFDQVYGFLKPIIIVKYERSYFNLENLRFTFDKNINYKSLNNMKETCFDKETVMEIKASPSDGDDYINNIISRTDSRFSKYTRGISFFKNI